MSYRELRNMTNLLRKVGYTRLVSLESFRTPNFKLVEDILRWFVQQLEPDADFNSYGTGTEAERVIFIRAFVELMLKKVNLKLNPKRLYQADGYAVRELLKVTEFLNNVMKEVKNAKPNAEAADLTAFYQFQPSLTNVRKAQEEAAELTKKGVSLFDLLSKEVHLRANRTAALTRHFDLKEFEATIQAAIGTGQTELTKLEAGIETAESNLTIINTKIEKKKQELERSEQRLQTMNKVRPAYMDEYEKIQAELSVTYLAYVTRFKILCHLQHQMDEISRVDEARRAEEKLIKQDLEHSEDILLGRGVRAFSGSEDDDDDSLEDSVQQNARDFLISRAGAISKLQRPTGTARNEMSLGGGRTAHHGNSDEEFNPDNELVADEVIPGPSTVPGKKSARKPRHVIGSMFGLEDDEETDDESDLILLDGQNEHSDLGSDIDDEELLMMRSLSEVSAPTNLKKHVIREEIKHNPDSARLNGITMLNKPPPPAPNVSNSNSKEDMRGHLMRQEEIEEQHRQAKMNRDRGSSKTSAKTPNGKQRTPHVPVDDASFDLGDDSITKPLEPEPRYTAAVVASTSNRNHQNRNGGPTGGAMMGNGRVPTNPPKSSGARKKPIMSNKSHPKPEMVDDEPLPERPPTRPGSQAKEFASHLQLISDDDDF